MLSSLIADPVSTIIYLLLAMPGRLLAISCHEWAHAWMANKCGDPTAKNVGRMTINPMAHLDLIGFLMMMLAGFGWARPVPVNPRNFRNLRRDDLKVSLAGITMNIILFLGGMTLLYLFVGMALYKLKMNPSLDVYYVTYFFDGYMLQYAHSLSEMIIEPAFGSITMYAYQMISYFTITNLVLAIFNLIPVPPLDGYHVLDDLVLHRMQIRIPHKAQQWLMLIMMLLIFSGGSSWLIMNVENIVFRGIGNIAAAVFAAIGLI